AIKQSLLADKRIQAFLNDHPSITNDMIERNLMTLHEFVNQTPCEHCQSVETCKNMIKGYEPVLELSQNDIHISYKKCVKKIREEKRAHAENLIRSLYMPKEILEASIENIDPDPVREPAVIEMINFAREAKNKLPEKGLYLSGPFGAGTRDLLGALTNRLSEYNLTPTLTSMPEFVRELRAAIRDDTVTEHITRFKPAAVLGLDDIGAERQAAW